MLLGGRDKEGVHGNFPIVIVYNLLHRPDPQLFNKIVNAINLHNLELDRHDCTLSSVMSGKVAKYHWQWLLVVEEQHDGICLNSVNGCILSFMFGNKQNTIYEENKERRRWPESWKVWMFCRRIFKWRSIVKLDKIDFLLLSVLYCILGYDYIHCIICTIMTRHCTFPC